MDPIHALTHAHQIEHHGLEVKFCTHIVEVGVSGMRTRS